ncbi:homoserine dehydrogenase [Halomonas nitroreducens]|uniref:homoserine dehydrogenase n=1 Tax=Halomonas nitroreducens TaxID=447425 RepID=A0A3S0KQL7_9GAMM|nr:homoserine dehydrogenase [Halomonas nitroreducens]RTR02984.1 homoserine dehydrogenase [Halomonas nitroreducens]
MAVYNVSLIGFGGVNRALVSLIRNYNDEWMKKLGFRLNIVGVSDLHLGSLISPNGVDAEELLKIKMEKGGLASLDGGCPDPRSMEVIRQAPADIIVEATFTDPKTAEPAISYCRTAFEAGRSVVTTNKGPVALAARELIKLAQQKNVGFEYEGAVMSGTPVIRLAKKSMAGADITGFQGILNGTSNYVVGRMEMGLSFNEAVAEAQEKGFAEANPAADVEGLDIRLKVVILANEILGANLKPDDVSCSGILGLTPADLEDAVSHGERWKLIGSAEKDEDGFVSAQVKASRLPSSHPLASISGATNAVTFSTELLGDVTVTGPGAGRIETAYALLSDIITLHHDRCSFTEKGDAE